MAGAQFATTDLACLATKRGSNLILSLFLWGLTPSFITFKTPFQMATFVTTGRASIGRTMLKKLGFARIYDAHSASMRLEKAPEPQTVGTPPTRTTRTVQCLGKRIALMGLVLTGGLSSRRNRIGSNFNAASVPQRSSRAIGRRVKRLS